jgi:hypothetical protein
MCLEMFRRFIHNPILVFMHNGRIFIMRVTHLLICGIIVKKEVLL